MRRRTIYLGWPRYDPKRCRFAMPNAVWEYALKPVEFLVFSYLCYCRSADALTLEAVASGAHMTVPTVQKYLSSLTARGLINEDSTPALKDEGTKFFTLPNEIFLLQLPPSAFLVYAYLLLIEDRQLLACHPSYNTLASATGISKNTAIKSIGTLLETGLIAVESSNYFDKHGMKWKGNNLYTIQPIKPAIDAFHQRQLHQLELDAERRYILRQQMEYGRRRPRAALCASASAPATPDPSQQSKPPCGR